MRNWLILGVVCATLSLMGVTDVFAQTQGNASTTTDQKALLLRPAIQLDSITAVKQTEKGGDEIYVGIAEFNSNGKNRYYTIPQSPVYWPAQGLNQISNFQLWQGKLPAGGATEVVISLIEQDTPPWDLDDLIGVVKVKMVNDKGTIHYEWYQDGKLISKKQQSVNVMLTGSGGLYRATLSLLMRDNNKAAASPDPVKDKK